MSELDQIRKDLLAWVGLHRGKAISEEAMPRFHEIIDALTVLSVKNSMQEISVVSTPRQVFEAVCKGERVIFMDGSEKMTLEDVEDLRESVKPKQRYPLSAIDIRLISEDSR